MLEVGRDIFKHGFTGASGNTLGHKRLRFVYWWIFVLAFVVFAGRTLQLGIQGTNRARPNYGKGAWLVDRADIIDRNGDILAKNLMSCHIRLNPRRVKNVEEVAKIIHDSFPYEYSVPDVLKLLERKHGIPIKNFASDDKCKEVSNKKIDGIEIELAQKRKYPKRRLFSHIIGFVGNEGHGLEGLEKLYDEYLIDNRTEPMQLSLDSRIQSVIYEQLSAAMQKYSAKAAMGLLMNSRTGEMIAMVSLPDYDPENIGLNSPENILFKPMRATFEMGSIFKIFNTALAMENGISKEYYVKEPFKIYDKFGHVAKQVTDVKSFKPPRPKLTVEEIMLHSCNVGSAQIALDFPEGAQQEFMHRIHLDVPLDLEFGKTERTLMPKKWGPVERATVSYGHGISVTPMHLLLAVNSMINGGVYIYPTIHKKSFGPLRGERVLSDDISARLRGVMLRIAEETTAKQARIAGIKIGGKTATAEKIVNGKFDKFKNLTAFAGIFPADAPQYTILVILDEPKGTEDSFGLRTAAWNAVPTTRKILDSILPLLFE